MNDLFTRKPSHQPLADRLRPQSLEEVVGQGHLLGSQGKLSRLLEGGRVPSLILWGPPGTGKTTIARLIAKHLGCRFTAISAVFSGVAELKKIFSEIKNSFSDKPHILFIDEIHRFNKAQQDALLGPLEEGLFILVGATTENPSFALNSALMSRAQVLTLLPLSEQDLNDLLLQAEDRLSIELPLEEGARLTLVHMADGDGRMLLNMVETLLITPPKSPLRAEDLPKVLQKRAKLYDKSGDQHYNLISAFIKSMRGSDPDAALYWMNRMLEGGEDPIYLARRMIRFAAEDIGLADPQALIHTTSALMSFQQIGSPEGELILANAVVYLATAPKSNAIYIAYKASLAMAQKSSSFSPPKYILNAPSSLMKEEEYGKGYVYDHDTPHGFSGQNYFPEAMAPQKFYQPKNHGFEKEIIKRLEYWKRIKETIDK